MYNGVMNKRYKMEEVRDLVFRTLGVDGGSLALLDVSWNAYTYDSYGDAHKSLVSSGRVEAIGVVKVEHCKHYRFPEDFALSEQTRRTQPIQKRLAGLTANRHKVIYLGQDDVNAESVYYEAEVLDSGLRLYAYADSISVFRGKGGMLRKVEPIKLGILDFSVPESLT